MPTFDKTIFGAPCWVDLTSVDLEGTKSFYTAIFGWDFADMGPEFGNYNIISVGEDVVGGSMQYNAEFMGPNPINVWALYFATPDVAGAVQKAKDLGGAVNFPPMQVGDQGSNAEVTDPTGASFGLWQPDQRKGYDRWGEHGFPAWFELHTRDFDAASEFYGKLQPVTLGSDDMTDADGMRYHTLNVDGEPTAGIFDATEHMAPDQSNGWIIYFGVNSCEEAVAAAKQHGGQVVAGPMDSPYGRFATVLDPQGAVFNVIQVQ